MIMTVMLTAKPDNGQPVTSEFTVSVPDGRDTIERTYERTLDGLYANLAMQLTSLGAALVAAASTPVTAPPVVAIPGQAAAPAHMLTGGQPVRPQLPPAAIAADAPASA